MRQNWKVHESAEIEAVQMFLASLNLIKLIILFFGHFLNIVSLREFFFPRLPVKRLVVDALDGVAVDGVRHYAHAVRIRSRRVKGLNAADGAEGVTRRSSPEAIRRQLVEAAQQAEFRGRNDKMPILFLGANRATKKNIFLVD